MQIKVSDMTPIQLGWTAAHAEGRTDVRVDDDGELVGADDFDYTTDWSLAGPIIEREKISIAWVVSSYTHIKGCWSAHIPQCNSKILYGQTPLIAAMRCYVASKLGDTVEVPNELLAD
jgi:hypothetical protein